MYKKIYAYSKSILTNINYIAMRYQNENYEEKRMKKIFSIMRNNMFMLSYIYRFCPSHITVTLLVSILASISSVTSLFITRYIINAIQNKTDSNVFNTVSYMVILLFTINIIHMFISNYIQQIIIPKNTQVISQQMQAELFRKASIIEMKHYDNPDFFNVFSMALQQSDTRAQSVLDTFNMLIGNLFSIGALLTLISALEPILLLMVIINVIISFCINTAITKLQHNFAQERMQAQREIEYSKFIFYRTENVKELRLYKNLKDMFIDKVVQASTKIIQMVNKYGKKILFQSCVQSSMSSFISSSTLMYLAYKVIKGTLFIGDFVTLSSSSQQLSMEISQLINSFPQMYEHSLYIDNFKEFIAYTPPTNYGNGLEIKEIEEIQFKNVFFTYPQSNVETIQNFNLRLKAGEKIAIVGENGAGKSTIVKLLSGLYELTSGEIIINGNNITQYDLGNYQECISVVFQDYKVYALSIAENILMHSIDEKQKKREEKLVMDALKFVGLYNKVIQLPDGIYTKLTKEFSNEGAVFSGGELQKIALARAYVSNCSLIILDEPSSSLDPISEYEMLKEMITLSKNKCSIIISHRLKNIKNVDCIYVIRKGSIIEQGTHGELMKKKGLYYNMYNKQTREIGDNND